MKKRVKIPTNPAQLVTLAKRVRDKHTVDGAASTLNVLNWQEANPIIDEAILLQENTERLKRELMESYQKRDHKLESVARFLRNSRDVLTGVNDKEMKTLGQWGYEVLDAHTFKTTQPAENGASQRQLTV